MKKIFLIINVNSYFKKFKDTKKNKFYFITKKKDLNYKKISTINPNLIFIPHWHWKITDRIIKDYTCIGFHSAPLPYGRGGSPIQNLIIRGFKQTQICAFKMNDKFDAGEIFIRKKLSLKGNGNEIFLNLYKKIEQMIKTLILNLPNPKKQIGKVVFFKRRTPKQSEINFNNRLNFIHDFIRMLDIDKKNFPKAFINAGKYKIILYSSKLNKKHIAGNFILKKNNE